MLAFVDQDVPLTFTEREKEKGRKERRERERGTERERQTDREERKRSILKGRAPGPSPGFYQNFLWVYGLHPSNESTLLL